MPTTRFYVDLGLVRKGIYETISATCLMFSIWEKQSFLQYDVVIVGGGISGISTAISLKEKNNNLNVLILEKGILPTGASTKNAGFACFGSLTELLEDIDSLGIEGMMQLVKMRWEGLQLTIDRLGESRIDLKRQNGYELILDQTDYSEQIKRVNGFLANIFETDVFSLDNRVSLEYGFNKVQSVIKNQFEAQLDTGKLISSLWEFAGHLGVKIATGAHVSEVSDKEVILKSGEKFKAKAVVLCTNAFTPSLKKVELEPGRGIVLQIRPENKLKLTGTFHYDRGYYYFRDYYGDLLFGGGRNIAFEEERTTTFELNQLIVEKLKKDLDEIILPCQSYKIVNSWTGIMAFGQNKAPIIKKTEENLFMGVKLGGMGVAIGSKVGDQLSDLVLTSTF